MRGAGEPLWDYDQDEHGDVMNKVRQEDESGRRLELELLYRFVREGYTV